MLALAGGGLAATLPRRGFAQGAAKRVGVLHINGGGVEEWKKTFPNEFESLGYTQGRNLQLIFYGVPSSGPRGEFGAEELREGSRKRAAEMAAAGLDCMVANGEPHTRFLRDASRTIPIVTDVEDPVTLGFAASLSRPGGNITGLHGGAAEVALKTVELFRKLIPNLPSVGWIGFENFRRSATNLESAARGFGMQFRAVVVKSGDEAAIASMRDEMVALRREGCRAFVCQPLSTEMSDVMARTALEHRMALAAGQVRREGILLRYYSQRLPEHQREVRIPAIVARILRGERPAEIPFEGPTRYELAINLKTAAKIGIAIPDDVLVRADEVVR